MSSSRDPSLNRLRAFRVERRELQYTVKQYIDKVLLVSDQDVRRPMHTMSAMQIHVRGHTQNYYMIGNKQSHDAHNNAYRY